jgi:hypothetical protein
MKREKLDFLLSMYKHEVRFLKKFEFESENSAIGTFSGISGGNTYHLNIDGDHFNNIPGYIAYNQFIIAFYSRELEKRGFGISQQKSFFLNCYVTKFETQYKKMILKESFQGEITQIKTIHPREKLVVFQNEYSFDNAFFGSGEVVIDLRENPCL